ncbi:retropepsin-like domain-containing protein [Bdellovibrio sp. SKB1291214]|uniref:aspartyl protease family protein n=1 Tax=Bdellovibrio sp. SKB1291214 TaxID=1732569 RepID=UPI000B519237|nr:aspartyl protease family protein [Bdellovibrio sp. SKB1291214]UYL09236.1 retropepsin-like domain-containing protein [Bdellovibrio sp. SKB1291214]
MKSLILMALILIANTDTQAAGIALDTSGLFPQIECEIQGMRGLCALDLGADSTFISGKAAKGLKVTGEQSMQTLGGVQTYPVVEVKSLKVGGELLAANIKTLVQAEIPTTSGQELVGTIGADTFRNKTILLDNAKIVSSMAAIYIEPTSAQAKAFKTKSRMIPGQRPVIEMKMGSKTVRALFDTHASSAVTGAFVKNNPEFFKLIGRQPKTDIAGFTKSYMMAEPAQEICIQGQCAKNLWSFMVIPPQEGIDIILGIDYIQQYSWLLSPNEGKYSAIKRATKK